MKKRFYTLFMACFLLSGMAYSQDILLQSFDDPAAIGNWINSTAGSHSLTGSADAAEGSGSVSLSYNLVADQSWGGSVDIQMTPSGDTFEDLSGTEGISFWYKVITPASDVNTVNWTTKIFINSTGGTEEWHASLTGVIDDMSGEWKQAKIAFSAFAIPSWLTTYDGVLYPDQVREIQMQIVSGAGITTTGEILIDALAAYSGSSSNIGALLESFDVVGSIGNWINSTDGSYSLNSSTDAVEGDGAACLDYILIADQSWGGSVDLQFTNGGELFPDLTGDEGIRFNFKVTQPASVTTGVSLNVKLFVNSGDGTQTEQWHAALSNVIGDNSGEWQEAKLPFGNFAIPSWEATYDGVLYLDQIHTIEIQIVTNSMGIETNGVICFDNLTSYTAGDVTLYEGFKLNDFDGPSTRVNSWQNSTAGSYSLNASSDAVEGDSAACVSYTLVGDQGWGGSVDLQFSPADTVLGVFPDMTEHLGLSFWYKVTEPADIPGNVSFTVKVFVNSTGGTEEWQRTVGGVLANPSGEWIQVYVPFSSFAIPSWLTTYDGVLYQDQISDIQFQILAQEGTTTVGGICFDNLTSYDDEEVVSGTITRVSASVNIFPNPASTQLYITGLDNIETVQVFDMNGRLLKTVGNPYASVNVADLLGGFYVLKIYAGKEVYSAKFLKH
ncbi:MAG: T9SS type A sorting domain-containing protein [Lewinellaceae bacterium]|nr:T9SS type A sorting domain-containing protein [Phaeodactylibacter sp.]MCB9041580.1 T9SS type A sorting domain-containing protein [Lewinellaceae bacterium]